MCYKLDLRSGTPLKRIILKSQICTHIKPRRHLDYNTKNINKAKQTLDLLNMFLCEVTLCKTKNEQT